MRRLNTASPFKLFVFSSLSLNKLSTTLSFCDFPFSRKLLLFSSTFPFSSSPAPVRTETFTCFRGPVASAGVVVVVVSWPPFAPTASATEYKIRALSLLLLLAAFGGSRTAAPKHEVVQQRMGMKKRRHSCIINCDK